MLEMKPYESKKRYKTRVKNKEKIKCDKNWLNWQRGEPIKATT
jgi:hypothetical protein